MKSLFRSRFLFATLFVSTIVIYSCKSDSDPATSTCRPSYVFLRAIDSIAYSYNSNGRLTAMTQFSASAKTISSIDEFSYVNGRLSEGKTTQHGNTIQPNLKSQWKMEYGTDGLPSKLIETNKNLFQFQLQYITEFTHDSQGRLVRAMSHYESTTVFPGSFVYGYGYTYNDAGNVTVVKYYIPDNAAGPGATREVVARENLTFDNTELFYAGSEDVKTVNFYVYRHIPNKNNNLTAKISYQSFVSYFEEPVTITFTPIYNTDGRILSLSTTDIFWLPEFGTLTFLKAGYECK